MPIYAFECDACGHQFDRLQRLADADPTECPDCGASQVRRQLTAPSFRLAGAGWYETDFKKDGDKKRNLVDKPETSGDGGGRDAPASAEAKSDKKADGKAEPKTVATPEPAREAKREGGSKPAGEGKTESKPAPKSDAAPAKPASGTP